MKRWKRKEKRKLENRINELIKKNQRKEIEKIVQVIQNQFEATECELSMKAKALGLAIKNMMK